MVPTVRSEVAEGVATVTLDRPDRLNAWTGRMELEYRAAVAAAEDDPAVRVIVVTGAGRGFCAGADTRALGGMAGTGEYDTGHQERPATPGFGVHPDFDHPFSFHHGLTKPVIGAINGTAAGIGAHLALACDLVIAGERATFGAPEINVGLFPFMIAVLIGRNIGRKKMTELLLLGQRIDAAEALRLGIVNRVVAPDDFDAAVADWAAQLAAKSPLLLKLGKDALFHQQDMAFRDALAYGQTQLVLAQNAEDAQEGIAAFLEKRPPDFSKYPRFP